jgi:restriction system-associated AAA family ATPase
MKLKNLELLEPYRSLPTFSQTFPTSRLTKDLQEIDPICLVGLNGCGKSNLLELIADIFYFVDRYFLLNTYGVKKHRPYEPYAKSKEKTELFFLIEYTIYVDKKLYWVKIERKNGKTKKEKDPIFYVGNTRENYLLIQDGTERNYLPKVIAYTSGLNELLSMPFMELQDYYAREVTYQVKTKKNKNKKIIPPNLMLMTYDTNALILIANYLLNNANKLEIFNRQDLLRIKDLDSFRIVIQLDKGIGKGKEGGIELTKELEDYILALQNCATCSKIIEEEGKGNSYTFDYLVNDATKAAFRAAFGSPRELFEALYKLSLLNTFAISNDYRDELSNKRKKGIALKFPTISTLDKIFNIEQIEMILDVPKVRTQYFSLSDGEHQFIHIVGGVLLFDEKDSKQDILYLFDEPETHFNPEWRRRLFSLMMEKMENFENEIITTTHSPFILSDCRGYNVFVFKREGKNVSFTRSNWETYGSSFSFILKNIFGFEDEISEKSKEDLDALAQLGRDDLESMIEQIRLFGDSIEKLLVLKRIEDLKKELVN